MLARLLAETEAVVSVHAFRLQHKEFDLGGIWARD
jgi:hypothetical protein